MRYDIEMNEVSDCAEAAYEPGAGVARSRCTALSIFFSPPAELTQEPQKKFESSNSRPTPDQLLGVKSGTEKGK